MCLIIYSPNGIIPRDHLISGMTQNPHGWGFAVASKSGIYMRKGMTWGDFERAWAKKPDGPVVWHARYATHGEMGVSNCHPFYVNKDLVVAHNGIITEVDEHPKLSDTRMFVERILKKIPADFTSNLATLKLIQVYIGNSKLVFLEASGKATIINEAFGHWEGKRWYSNTRWIPVKRPEPETKEGASEKELGFFPRVPEYYSRLIKPEYRTK